MTITLFKTALLLSSILILSSCNDITDFFVSDSNEKQLGAAFHTTLKDSLTLLPQTAPMAQWVDSLGAALAEEQDRDNFKENDFHFYVVDDDIINAFATPGGYIYIYKGLIDKASNTDEVAGVIAHEIGHVAAKHYKEQVTKIYGLQFLQELLGAQTDNAIILTSAQLGTYLTNMKMSRNNESQADSLAVAYTSESTLKTNPRSMAHFLDTLTTMYKREPSKLEQLFATHPYAGDRSIDVVRLINSNQAYTIASQRIFTPKPSF